MKKGAETCRGRKITIFQLLAFDLSSSVHCLCGAKGRICQCSNGFTASFKAQVFCGSHVLELTMTHKAKDLK